VEGDTVFLSAANDRERGGVCRLVKSDQTAEIGLILRKRGKRGETKTKA